MAISPLCLAYGRHAASTAGLPEFWPAAGLRAVPIVDDAAVAEADADAGVPGQRTAAGLIAQVLSRHPLHHGRPLLLIAGDLVAVVEVADQLVADVGPVQLRAAHTGGPVHIAPHRSHASARGEQPAGGHLASRSHAHHDHIEALIH